MAEAGDRRAVGLHAGTGRGAPITAATTLFYLTALFVGWRWGEVIVMPASVLPVVVAAWYFGLAGSLPVGLLLAGFHLAGFVWLGGELGPLALQASVGNVLLVTAAAGVGLVRDRLRAQLARQLESEERYELAARGASDGLWDWNLHTDEVFYSESFANLLGEPDRALGRSPDVWLGRIHPEDVPTVRAQLDLHLRGEVERFQCEHRLRRADGSFFWVLGRGMATPAGKRGRRISGWLTDISERKRNEERLRHHAFHDPLTGLPNRALFMDRLAGALARSRRHDSQRFALLLLDLDRFKVVNDSLGHVAGDELLRAVARRLSSCVRPGDTVARLGGDEFMVLLEEVHDANEATHIAERMHDALAAPLPLLGHDVVTTASLGIAIGDAQAQSPHDLLRDADTAMYEAKSLGKGRHALFDEHMHVQAVQRLSMESALREAVERQQMRVYYQPIVDLSTGGICGFEALARWQHPERGMISPMLFIPLAEETGVISDIGQWILLAACSQLRSWQTRFVREVPLRVSVNLSVRQMHSVDIAERIRGALETTRLPPSSLAMEVTESVFLDHQSSGPALLDQIRRLGAQVYMDDFGTGYSSLGYLQQFRVDALKIDGSFVRNLDRSDEGRSLVRSIITLGKRLRLKVVAEGVETVDQLGILRELGCDEAQGYLFARPALAEDLEELLHQDRRW